MHRLSISPSARRLLTAFTLTASAAAFAQQRGSSFTSAAATDTTTPVWHETAIPADKKINTKVTEGVLTVDGLVAKVQLNYDIRDAGYLYVFVPGVGTAIVSRVNTYGSEKVKDAFHGKTLAFNAGGHSFELTSATAMTEGKEPKEAKQTQEAKAPKASKAGKPGKKDAEVKEVKDGPGDIYVRLDTTALNLDRYPMFGFGNTTRAPYGWPLSGPPTKDTTAHLVAPPPMPASVLPRTVASTTSSPRTMDRQ
jgi:hypothetical protein